MLSKEETKQKLIENMGKYPVLEKLDDPPSQKITNYISKENLNHLYNGIDDYESQRVKIVKKYLNNYEKKNLKDLTNPFLSTKPDPYFFRRRFIDYVTHLSLPNEATLHSRKTLRAKSPDDAAVNMEKFFGSQGTELYKLALEEEANSRDFRLATFFSSIHSVKGLESDKKMIIIIGGPSASGKSYGTQLVLDYLKKQSNIEQCNSEQNIPDTEPILHFLRSDGADARGTSAIMGMARDFSLLHGFSGIKDLHEHSKILAPVKDALRKCAFAEPKLGVILPETFSDFPLSSPLYKTPSAKLLEEVRDTPNSKVVFSQVIGTNKEQFKDSVKHMGITRAFCSKYNTTDQDRPESKKYGPQGFEFGRVGSIQAVKAFNKFRSPDDLELEILNDLKLVTKDGQPAKPGDGNALLVSQKSYNIWAKDRETLGDDTPSLETYNRSYAKTEIREVPSEYNLSNAPSNRYKSSLNSITHNASIASTALGSYNEGLESKSPSIGEIKPNFK